MMASAVASGEILLISELQQSHVGRSVRVFGKLTKHEPTIQRLIISLDGYDLPVVLDLLCSSAFVVGSLYQFIGETCDVDNRIGVRARVCRCVDGLDVALYKESLQIRRNFLKEQLERRTKQMETM